MSADTTQIKDYYAMLGVSAEATPEEIKRAFRKLAMECHPDRSPDKTYAEDRFKEINEAYIVLGNPEKKREYDSYGSEEYGIRFTEADIFKDFNTASVEDLLGDLHLGRSLFDTVSDQVMFDPMDTTMVPEDEAGADAHAEIEVTFEDAVLGGAHDILLQQAEEMPRSITVKIPPGTVDGGTLRLRGKGALSNVGGPAGDLYLAVKVGDHDSFRRRGEFDLETDITVGVLELVLGGVAAVPTLAAGDRRIKIRAGTQPDTHIRLQGYGVAGWQERPPGDLYARLKARIPESLTPEQQELLDKLRVLGL